MDKFYSISSRNHVFQLARWVNTSPTRNVSLVRPLVKIALVVLPHVPPAMKAISSTIIHVQVYALIGFGGIPYK